MNAENISATLPACTYYGDCTLPFERYIRATVHNDLSALVISGSPGATELDEAWTAINSEFCELVADPSTRSRHEQSNYVLTLSARIFAVSVMVQSCRTTPDARLVARLKDEFPDVDFDTEDGDDLFRALDQIEIEMVADKIELQCAEAEMNGKSGDEDDEQEDDRRKPAVTESIFFEILLEISHHERRSIAASDIITRDYALLLKRLRRHQAMPRPGIYGL